MKRSDPNLDIEIYRKETFTGLGIIIYIYIITVPFHETRLNWVHDPAPSPPRRMEHTITVPPSDSSANSSDSSVSVSSNTRAPISSDSTSSPPKPVSVRKTSENEVSAIATRGSSGAPLSPALPKKCRRRRRRQARRAANRNSAASSAAPMTADERWTNQRAAGHAGTTQPQLEGSDTTSSKRTAVYPPSRIVDDSAANENSPFQLGLESSRFPGLYKPAVPDQHQTLLRTTRWVINNRSYSRGWGSTKVEVWDCLPIAATRPTPRHQRRRRCCPSRASRWG